MRPKMLSSTLLVAALAACENPVEETPNKLPSADAAATASTPDIADGETCDCLAVGQWFRFDALTLLTIDGTEHPVLPTLNGLWASDIAGNELNIMLEVTDVQATSVTMKVVNGARVDGTQDVCELADTAVTLVFPRDGCHLQASQESAFNVYAGTEDFPKNCTTTLPVHHAIPVSRARLEGTLTPTCDAIVGGKVPSGGLGQAELAKICTCLLLPGDSAEQCGALEPGFADTACVGCNAKYQALDTLLTAFGDVKWSCQTGDGAPAACLTADFTAKSLAAGPRPCNE